MYVTPILPTDDLWEKTMAYAKSCSWEAGAFLAKQMQEGRFKTWRRVFVTVTEQDEIIGFCTLTKTDVVPNVTYTPYIGFVFVDERFRGQRLSEKMIQGVMAYASEIGFLEVYLTSDHVDFYEKYGFEKIDEQVDYWGRKQGICRKDCSVRSK